MDGPERCQNCLKIWNWILNKQKVGIKKIGNSNIKVSSTALEL